MIKLFIGLYIFLLSFVRPLDNTVTELHSQKFKPSEHRFGFEKQQYQTADQRTNQHLYRILESLKSEIFRHNQVISRSILKAATDRLSSSVPLFRGCRVELAGSAFEGTSVADTADFDSFIVLNNYLTSHLEIVPVNEENIWFKIRIRKGTSKGELLKKYPQLQMFCHEDGYMNLLQFKKWAFNEMAKALIYAFNTLPYYRRSVYFGVGAVGADVWPKSGASFSLDFVPTMGLTNQLLRSNFLNHCSSAPIVSLPRDSPDHNWFLVSLHNVSAPSTNVSSEYHAVAGTQMLERHLIRTLPILQEVNRLLKTLRLTRKWPIVSFVLKHALLNTYRETCRTLRWHRSNLKQLLLASLQTLVKAIDKGRLDEFFFEHPANLLYLPLRTAPRYSQIKTDIKYVINSINSGNNTVISELFRLK